MSATAAMWPAGAAYLDGRFMPVAEAMIPVTEVKGSAFFSAIGLNPSVEALSIQFLVILFALTFSDYSTRNWLPPLAVLQADSTTRSALR